MRYAILLLRCCLLLTIAGLPFSTSAQVTVDSTRSSYTEEHISYSEEVLTKPLKSKAKPALLDTATLRVQREDRDLWKLGLNNVYLSDESNRLLNSYRGYRRLGIHLAYERKLYRPAWSALAELSPAVMQYRRPSSSSGGSEIKQSFAVRAQLAGRYYYNLERRIRQGRGAGNFSANYFSLALGSSFDRFSDLPYYLRTLSARRLHAEAALLYGIQRRWGHYGFIDFNAGVGRLLTEELNYQKWQMTGSLRVGLVLGAAPAHYAPSSDDDAAARSRAYIGTQAGVYGYYIPSERYYSNLGVGIGPYIYAGYYLRPRLAMQVGLQYQYNQSRYSQFSVLDGYDQTTSDEYTFAIPVVMRYSLTKTFAQRVQFDVVGGVAVLTGLVHSQSVLYQNGQPMNQSTGREQTWAVNPMAGLDIAYGFGRKRQLQVTAEGVLIKPIAVNFQNRYGYLRPGVSVGLRYRFKYL
ncbi:hypothetical protein F1C16_18335 [Hymenobacter sp. NBH84]|uniref:hypothetical protein n=1 Tax=Hymenobacter sp. NBH84 TaxID=2596915 RepID=UPI0016273B38|nr:hypothetical protein [Hymenobacter sp. NBH84]QNE41374.1 hypothetical protein F1C16_18335 [Hymenobacter sp. NBH84]